MPALLRILVVHYQPGFGRPGDPNLRAGPVHISGVNRARDRYQQPIAANDDALEHFNEVGLIIGFCPPLIGFKGSKNGALYLCGRDASDRPRRSFPPAQQRRTDVEAITHSVFCGEARAHAVATVVVELAQEEGAAFGSFCFPATRLGDEQLLDPVKSPMIDDGFVLAVEPFAAVVNLAEIDAVLQEVGEGTEAEGNAAAGTW